MSYVLGAKHNSTLAYSTFQEDRELHQLTCAKGFPFFWGNCIISHTQARTTLVSGTTPLETPFRVKTLQLLCITCNVVYSPDLYGLN